MLSLDEEAFEMKNSLKDWRKALRTPATYRVGSTTVRVQTQFVVLVSVIGLFVLVLFYYNSKLSSISSIHRWKSAVRKYNSTYPLTSPIKSGNDLMTFRIGAIADLDTNSKSTGKENLWLSYFLKGYLSYDPSKNSVVVTWDSGPPITLSSSYSLKGRGMELSELVVFDGRLLTFDDRTGMVYEIINDKVVPWVILIDGDGHNAKGFKSEWASVRGEVLYVGSMGKEWTTAAGVFESFDPMWVKGISVNGEIRHESWVERYKQIRSIIGIGWPGYMIHESGMWSSYHNKWFFLPRRCSKESYNETKDELMGCNIIITADSSFSSISYTKIGDLVPYHGFSSFKFIPGSNDQVIIALKTMELHGATATFITAFTIGGEVLLKNSKISDLKYEGLEFI